LAQRPQLYAQGQALRKTPQLIIPAETGRVREGDPAAEKSWNGYAKFFILAKEEKRLELTFVRGKEMVRTLLDE
jgi:hypothetical protein